MGSSRIEHGRSSRSRSMRSRILGPRRFGCWMEADGAVMAVQTRQARIKDTDVILDDDCGLCESRC
eukprot:scaffold20276_cov224-Skeletonema_marinoi.AAC.10